MDPSSTGNALALVLILLGGSAFFSAAEFVLVAVRRGRLERVLNETNGESDDSLPELLERADDLALVAQIGSTLCALLLGTVAVLWGTGAAAAGLLAPFGPTGRTVIALAVVLLAHVTIGTHLPKVSAIHRSEWMARHVALRPLRVLDLLLRPLTAPLRALIRALERALRLPATGYRRLAHTPEEIRLLVAEGHEQGVVEEDEREMVYGVFQFSDTVVREVMTPRTEMVAVARDIDIDGLIEIIRRGGHSRLPVFEGSTDNVVGILLVKDLLPHLHSRDPASPFDVTRVMREPYFVPDTKPVDDLLAEFRQASVHLAIVLDEFGGTYGLVTLEDLLEEIVGEIQDEYDVPEVPEFETLPEGDVLIHGGASISEVNERCGLALPEADFDTVGGFIFGSLGRVPRSGDTVVVETDGGAVDLRVETIEGHRISRVRLSRESLEPAPVTDRPEKS